MSERIYLSSPHMGGTEQKYINEAFAKNWVAPLGENVDGFENDISVFYNNDIDAVALNSGTAAIHLALILLGVRPGDEVICQNMTFAASANPIIYLGATPIFIDSEKDTLNISPLLLENCIKDNLAKKKKPKAIISVHLYGMPAKMDEILAIANRYEIPLIEDAAEALGSSINGKYCGSFGDLGILSFNGNKIITTSAGGALISRNSEYISKARFLSSQAKDPAPYYQHSSIGYNYRMSNICAGIGRGQMEVLSKRISQRRAVFETYKRKLCEYPGISFVNEPDGYFSNRWLTTIFIDPVQNNGITKETLQSAFENDNIESRPLWKPMHLQPIFEKYQYYGDNLSNKLFETGLCLPSGPNLTDGDLDRIVGIIDRLWECKNG